MDPNRLIEQMVSIMFMGMTMSMGTQVMHQLVEEPGTTRGVLSKSVGEEYLAATLYLKRAKLARALGDIVSSDLFMHIREEELTHAKEFNDRMDNLRPGEGEGQTVTMSQQLRPLQDARRLALIEKINEDIKDEHGASYHYTISAAQAANLGPRYFWISDLFHQMARDEQRHKDYLTDMKDFLEGDQGG